MFKIIITRNLAKVARNVKPKQELSVKARTIKNLNHENKALFGAVVKEPKASTESQAVTESSADEQSPVEITPDLVQSAHSSEMYWLLERGNTAHKTIRKSGTSIASTETVPAEPILPTPFSDTELRSIVNFPLIPSTNGLLERNWTMHEQYETEEYKSPSVNKILTATMTEQARRVLLRWKATKIAELGEEGFAEYQKATLERGSNFHSCLETWLSDEPIDEEKLNKAKELWASINGSLGRVQRPAQIIERKIYHPYLHYNGVVDCVSSVDNKLHIIEWKTSENQKPNLSSTYDAPVQLCAYLGALKADPQFADLDISQGAVFVAYTNGHPAHVHLINQAHLKKYWAVWVKRLQEYWVHYRDQTLPEPI